MIDCYFLYEKESIHCLMNNIWSLPKLTRWKFNRPFPSGTWLEEISVISYSVKYVSIEKTECYFSNLAHLFNYTPYLRQISTSIPLDLKNEHVQNSISSIISLKLLFNGSISAMKNLLDMMLNLSNVTLHITSFYLDGYEWEKILINYFPKIKLFKLKMDINLPNIDGKENQIRTFLDSFQTHF